MHMSAEIADFNATSLRLASEDVERCGRAFKAACTKFTRAQARIGGSKNRGPMNDWARELRHAAMRAWRIADEAKA